MRSINALEARLDRLSLSEAMFARSLIGSVRKYGSPTEKQRACLVALWEKTEPKAARTVAPPMADFSAVNAMFDKAAEKLKRPFVKLAAGDEAIKVAPAKATSSNPGYLYITRDGEYLGKIGPSGTFYSAVNAELSGEIIGALQAFAAAPEATAKAYGQRFGECCFCARPLSDSRSVDAGYGPICADRFGLAWG